MKFIAVTALFVGALAAPTEMEIRTNNPSYNPCPNGLYSNAVCVANNVLNVLCLDVAAPSEAPRDARHFRDICAAVGKAAFCAVLPVAGQGVLCTPAVGAQ